MLDDHQNEIIGLKEPFLTGSQIKKWVDFTFKDPLNPERLKLRKEIVTTYSQLFEDVSVAPGYQPFPILYGYDYGINVQEVLSYVLLNMQMSSPPTLEQMEVVGFAALMERTLENHKDNFFIHPYELRSRLKNVRSLNINEDWLTSTAFLTFYKDFQYETMVKNQAYQEGVTLLQSKEGVAFTDIEEVYRSLFKAVYPSAEDVPDVIEEGVTSMHNGLIFIKDILNSKLMGFADLIQNEKPGRSKRNYLIDLLDDYNRALEDKKGDEDDYKHAKILAEIFAKYVFIHPHPDANNSMARILTNNYLATHGIKQIDWSKIKTDEKSYVNFNDNIIKWWEGEEFNLIDWFMEKIEK